MKEEYKDDPVFFSQKQLIEVGHQIYGICSHRKE